MSDEHKKDARRCRKEARCEIPIHAVSEYCKTVGAAWALEVHEASLTVTARIRDWYVMTRLLASPRETFAGEAYTLVIDDAVTLGRKATPPFLGIARGIRRTRGITGTCGIALLAA